MDDNWGRGQDSFYRGVPGFPVTPGWAFSGNTGKYANGKGNSLEWHRGSRRGCRQISIFLRQENCYVGKRGNRGGRYLDILEV